MGRQRIGTLTPLDDIERWIAANVAPTPAREPLGLGGVLGGALIAARTVPAQAVAAIDGFAVSADETFGATLYTPTPLTQAVAIDAGEALPQGTDAVIRASGVVSGAAGIEAAEAVAPGENVRHEGEDGRAGELVRPAGSGVAIGADIAGEALGAAAMAAVPQLRCVATRALACAWPRLVFGAFGCATEVQAGETPDLLRAALREGRGDAVILHGGTGEGRNDFAVELLAELGELAFHGIALDPGETAAIGLVGGRPVLCLPGRPEAGLAVALTLGRALVRRLKGAAPMPQPMIRGRLTRKVVASPGRTRLVYVDVQGEAVEPLGSSGLPLVALARALGALILPPGLEGYREGALVDVMPLPGYPVL